MNVSITFKTNSIIDIIYPTNTVNDTFSIDNIHYNKHCSENNVLNMISCRTTPTLMVEFIMTNHINSMLQILNDKLNKLGITQTKVREVYHNIDDSIDWKHKFKVMVRGDSGDDEVWIKVNGEVNIVCEG